MNTPVNRNRPANTSTTLRSDATAPTNTTVTPAKPGATAPAGNHDGVDTNVHNASHDMRYRVGVNAVSTGSTTTAVPSLLKDWKTSLYEAAAEGLAHEEVIAPVLTKALAQAETDKGDALSRGEKRQVRHDVETSLKKEFKTAFTAHHQDLTKSPSSKQKTERDVLLDERPRISQLKDPFTAVIQDAPGARQNEIVLWENKNAMVVVDTFAESPKALVVPKMPLNLPTDAPKGLLEELALIAAHVSDAFMRSTGCPAAGIWINPPQHLTVKQMHVHVLPDIGGYTAEGDPAKAFIENPQFRPQIDAYFDVIKGELKSKLGASSI